MEQSHKNQIYDRLLAIKVKIEAEAIPSPQYVNEKIGECSIAIEEIERYSIEVSKEISVLSQASNNAISDYEYKKEMLFQTEEIKSLPNIKDRESRANSRLKCELDTIRSYKNELTDLNNLLKQVSLKIRNLNRVNTDIKMQLRILEAQIKLSGGTGTDDASRSLMEEMKKGIYNEDIFGEPDTETTIVHVEDPSSPLDVNNLLKQDAIAPELVDPVPDLPDPEDMSGTFLAPEFEEKYDVPQEVTVQTDIVSETVIDLEDALDIVTEKGGTPAVESKPEPQKAYEPVHELQQTVTQVADAQKEDHPKKQEFDLDALLDSIQKTTSN
jgi:hypothetical protein